MRVEGVIGCWQENAVATVVRFHHVHPADLACVSGHDPGALVEGAFVPTIERVSADGAGFRNAERKQLAMTAATVGRMLRGFGAAGSVRVCDDTDGMHPCCRSRTARCSGGGKTGNQANSEN